MRNPRSRHPQRPLHLPQLQQPLNLPLLLQHQHRHLRQLPNQLPLLPNPMNDLSRKLMGGKSQRRLKLRHGMTNRQPNRQSRLPRMGGSLLSPVKARRSRSQHLQNRLSHHHLSNRSLNSSAFLHLLRSLHNLICSSKRLNHHKRLRLSPQHQSAMRAL